MSHRLLCWLYGVLAVLGAAATWYFNIRFSLEAGGGFDLAAFIRGGFANYAAASLTMDVSVAAMTFLAWMLVEAGRLGMRKRWLYVILTFCVALAFAFPFFLLMREKHISRAPLNTGHQAPKA